MANEACSGLLGTKLCEALVKSVTEVAPMLPKVAEPEPYYGYARN